MCLGLCTNLRKYLVEHLKIVREGAESLIDEYLLRYYAEEWNKYTTGATYINRLFTGLNRLWVNHIKGARRKGIYTVYLLALVQWKQNVLDRIQSENAKLSNAMIGRIEKERNGETIDQTLLRKAIDSFVSLGINEDSSPYACPTNACDPNIDVYCLLSSTAGANLTGVNLYNVITRYLVAQLKVVREGAESLSDENLLRYYAKEWDRYTTDAYYINRSFTYLNRYWVQREEDVRQEGAYTFSTHWFSGSRTFFDHLHYKNAKLAGAVIKQIEKERNGEIIGQILVNKVVDFFVSQGIDEGDPNTHSLDVYKHHFETHFIAATESYHKQGGRPSRPGLEPLRKKFEEHDKRSGLAAVEKLVSGSDSNGEESIDPKADIDALLEMHKKNNETVKRSFRGEVGFVTSLDKACREFIIGMLLQMSEEGSLESALDQVYIEDKDVFQDFYTNKLSKRLIHGASASDEAESSMISKLKEACGFEYTQKLQRMFTDMSLSKDVTDSFKEKMVVSHPEDSDLTFTIQILGANVWPLKSIFTNFVIPKEILHRFQQCYQQKHSGRRLTRLWAYRKNELRSNYTSPQKFIFMTSSFQMAVPVQYNDYDSLSFEELQANTGIPADLLKQVLIILCKARVLFNDGEGEPYDLRVNYKSKIKVNLNQSIKATERTEITDILEDIGAERKLILQATIVRCVSNRSCLFNNHTIYLTNFYRIMKARKTTKSQELIQDVISHVSAWFAPEVLYIKEIIGTLLEQEFIERVEGTSDMFAYLA
ncbi:CDC53_3 [Sanghuangporus sanghuang]